MLNRKIITLEAATGIEGFCPDVLVVATGEDLTQELESSLPGLKRGSLVADTGAYFDKVTESVTLVRLRIRDACGWHRVYGKPSGNHID